MSRIKKIFGEGLAIAIPLSVVIYVFIKIVVVFKKLVAPVAANLGIDRILGELTLTLLALLLLFLIIIILGLLMRLPFLEGFGKSVEDVVLKFVPSLNNIKSLVAEKLHLENISGTWTPVLFLHEGKYAPAFVIEELNDLITLYVIKGTAISDGEILITKKTDIELTNITANQIHKFSKQYGKGYLSLIKKTV